MANTTAVLAPSPDLAEETYPSSTRRWFTVGVLTGLYAVSLVDRQVFALLIEPIRKSLNVNDFQIALLHGMAFAMFYAVFGMLFGWAADRFPRRGVVLGGVSAWSVATMACGLARNIWQLGLARFGVGAGEAALNPAAYSIITDVFPRHRVSTAIAVFGTGALIGDLSAKLAGAFLMSVIPSQGLTLPIVGQLEPWRAVFLFVGLPGLALGSLVWLFPEPARRQRAGVAKVSVGDAAAFMWRSRDFFLPFFIGCALIYATNTAFAVWAPTYMIRHFGLSVSQVGFMMAATSVGPQIGGTMLAGFLADHFFARGRTTIHIYLAAAMALFKGLFIIAGVLIGAPWPAAILFGAGTLFSGIVATGPAALQMVTPNERRGQVSATYLFLLNLLGLGLGPAITGAIATYVFKDRAMIGQALVVTILLLQPLAFISVVASLKGMRRMVSEAQAWTGAGEEA
jgi:MFS family permease